MIFASLQQSSAKAKHTLDTASVLEEIISRLDDWLNDRTQLIEQLQAMQDLLERCDRRIGAIESKLAGDAKRWLNKREAAQLLNIDEATLARYRRAAEWHDGSFAWINGLHYHAMPVVQSSGTGRSTASYEYSRELLQHWQIHRLDWAAHQKFIDAWVKRVGSK